jgi:hypothetical protein
MATASDGSPYVWGLKRGGANGLSLNAIREGNTRSQYNAHGPGDATVTESARAAPTAEIGTDRPEPVTTTVVKEEGPRLSQLENKLESLGAIAANIETLLQIWAASTAAAARSAKKVTKAAAAAAARRASEAALLASARASSESAGWSCDWAAVVAGVAAQRKLTAEKPARGADLAPAPARQAKAGTPVKPRKPRVPTARTLPLQTPAGP